MERQDKFFDLGEGEEIIESIKPKKGLIWYFFSKTVLGKGVGNVIVLLLFFIFAFYYGFLEALQGIFMWSLKEFLISIIIIVISVPLLVAYLRYRHQYYWITNKRVIYKRGLIGYSVTSVPLERVSDVIISRTFLERICGFGSILIQTLAGQISAGRRGAEASLLAIPEPERTQELIFKLVKRKREEEKLTM